MRAENILVTEKKKNGFNDVKFGVWCAIGAGSITETNISHERLYSQNDIRFLPKQFYIPFLEIKNGLWTFEVRKYYTHTANYFMYVVAGVLGERMISQRV